MLSGKTGTVIEERYESRNCLNTIGTSNEDDDWRMSGAKIAVLT